MEYLLTDNTWLRIIVVNNIQKNNKDYIKYIKHIQNAKERIRSNLCKNQQKTEKIRIVRHTD